jgi:hypothetical protein
MFGNEAKQAIESQGTVEIGDPNADVIHVLNIDHGVGLSCCKGLRNRLETETPAAFSDLTFGKL